MNYVKLKDVCTINMGQSPSSDSYNENGHGVPFFQGNADFGERYPVTRKWCSAPTKMVAPEDILISVRAPIGAMNYAKEECCIGRGLAALTPNREKVAPEYIFWLLKGKNEELNCKGTGSTFKAIGRNILEETLVPNISLEKQTECAIILEKTYRVILSRKQQLQKLDELVKARFVELFGDLKSNPMEWPVVPFTEFAKIDGNMTTDYEKYADYPHIGIDSIEKGTGALKGYRTVREDGVISGKYIFTPQHIIYSKIRPNLNKVALPDFEGLCSADAYPILPNHSNCNRVFLAIALRSEYFLEYILQFSSRTNLPKVNRKEITGFRMPLPPLKLQEQFAAFVEQTDKSKVVVQKALDEAQTLFDSLMQEYFG
jgi:type I restriction enzyme S subunit